MPFNNPFKKNDPDAAVAEGAGAEVTEPQKTPAELIAESLKPVTDGLGTITTTLQTLAQRVEAVETSTRRPAAPQNVEGAPKKISVFDDEEAFAAQTVAPVLMRQFETEARLVKAEVRREYEAKGYAKVWDSFEEEINKTLDATPLVKQNTQTGAWESWRGDAAYIRNVVNMIFGAAAIKAGMKFGGQDKGFFLEDTTSGEGSHTTGPVADGLTEGQRRVFDRMKGPDGKPISADARSKTLSKLKFIN